MLVHFIDAKHANIRYFIKAHALKSNINNYNFTFLFNFFLQPIVIFFNLPMLTTTKILFRWFNKVFNNCLYFVEENMKSPSIFYITKFKFEKKKYNTGQITITRKNKNNYPNAWQNNTIFKYQ